MARVFEFPGLEEEVAPLLRPAQINEMLRRGECPPEGCVDRFLPEELRAVSGQYWTPLEVIIKVAGWVDEFNIKSVVDIGSGVGKFCVFAALACRGRFIGLEQRGRLVLAARGLAQTFEVEGQVSFIEGTFGEIEAPRAAAYYLYNPFGENLFGASDHLDEDVELSSSRHARDTTATTRMLRDAPLGTFLITYNGFGGIIPAGYRKIRTELEFSSVLRLWRKTDPTRGLRDAP